MRIERWTKQTPPDSGQIHWRTITPDNITSVYGRNDNSRIYNPEDDVKDRRIFCWLLSETYDTLGNAIIYNYKEEDSVGVSHFQPHEANRNERSRSANRYIKSIQYGNTRPNRDQISWKAFSAFDLHLKVTPRLPFLIIESR